MEITEIKFRRFPTHGRLRALVSVTFDNIFAVHDIKVIAGDDHLFLAMPARRSTDGRYHDIVHPIGPLLRRANGTPHFVRVRTTCRASFHINPAFSLQSTPECAKIRTS